MQESACTAINQSVTSFVETPRGLALAHRGLRGELARGEFFTAACATAPAAARQQLGEAIPLLPPNLERAFLQAWFMASRCERRIEFDWQLGEPRQAGSVRPMSCASP